MGKKWKQWQFYFLGHQNHSKFHDCSHVIERHLLLGRKAMTNLDSILKSRDIPLPTKVCVQLFETPWTAARKASLSFISHKVCMVKAVVFSSSHVWMWELDHKEGWAPKNDAFELWCWRRLLRIPWTARRSNQPILKKISPEYSLEGLLLKLQYFGHLMWRAHSLKKTLMLRKIEVKRRRGQQRMRCLVSITGSVDVNLSKLQKIWRTEEADMLQSMGLQRVGH